MNKEVLNKIAVELSESPKGILAADESTNTIKKRFDSINIESNFENRRKYRELLFTTKDLNKYVSGIIFYDETVYQETSDGIPFPQYLLSQRIKPGIKVDTGAININKNSSEKVTEGLDGLPSRLEKYKNDGMVFTKWRAIIEIDSSKNFPTKDSINLNAYNLGRYARIVQDNEMVPIVEPEVLMDGEHTIEECYEFTSNTLKTVFEQLNNHDVFLGGILLKPNMIISAKNSKVQANIPKVAEMTLKCLKENVPEDVPGIVFLSGGQSSELATAHLNEMNKKKDMYKWNLSFSYGRALQQPSLNSWLGNDNQIEEAQKALLKRSKLNSNATLGAYSSNEENL